MLKKFLIIFSILHMPLIYGMDATPSHSKAVQPPDIFNGATDVHTAWKNAKKHIKKNPELVGKQLAQRFTMDDIGNLSAELQKRVCEKYTKDDWNYLSDIDSDIDQSYIDSDIDQSYFIFTHSNKNALLALEIARTTLRPRYESFLYYDEHKTLLPPPDFDELLSNSKYKKMMEWCCENIDLNSVDFENGNTFFHIFIKLRKLNNRKWFIETFAKYKCDPNRCNDLKQTPLYVATEKKMHGTMQVLLKCGAKVDWDSVRKAAENNDQQALLVFSPHNAYAKQLLQQWLASHRIQSDTSFSLANLMPWRQRQTTTLSSVANPPTTATTPTTSTNTQDDTDINTLTNRKPFG